MSTVKYKGFQGSVEYDSGSLFIRVLHVSDTLIAECDSLASVESEFEALIDEYLQDCAELGRVPDRPFKGSFNVRVEPELHRGAAMAAADESLSLNSWVAAAIKEKLECSNLSKRVDHVVEAKRQEVRMVHEIYQALHSQQLVRAESRAVERISFFSSTPGKNPWAQANVEKLNG